MATPHEPIRAGASEEWDALEPILRDFEAAWTQPVPPTLEDFLRRGHRPLLPLLIELVHVDLEFRLKAGESARVEGYLQRYPELASEPATVLDLIAAEFQLRIRGETGLTAESYLQRFPQYSGVLITRLRPLPLSEDRDECATVNADGDTRYRDAAGDGLPRVPGYELLGELGRGGMGVVYRARQARLGRLVALKMILGGGHASRGEIERFRAEAQAIARLQHPNIVQIHEVGQHAGLPFLSLEYCAGGSLAHKLAGTPLPAPAAAGLVETLARAMQAAHQHGVIHRDLKPANVLLQTTSDTESTENRQRDFSCPLSVSAVVKITDFGLARTLDEPGLTATGAVIGTPSYMAPEQAAGKVKELGPACDVYALGAILYECLTGRPPFKAATAQETMQQVLNDEPVPLRQLNAGVPRDLETVCLKCLHKEPGKRYASAVALATDLRRFQTGEPIAARPVGSAERLVKWVRRRPAAAALLAVSVLAAVVLLAGGLFFTEHLAAERDRLAKANNESLIANKKLLTANEETTTAYNKLTISEKAARDLAQTEKEARDQAEDLLATSNMLLAKSRFEENQAAAAEDLLEQVPAQFRLAGWGLLKNYVAGSLCTLRGHTFPVMSVAFAADGQVLASASDDVKLWDARTGQQLRTLRGHTGPVRSVAFAADGQVLASASDDHTAKLWDARTGQQLRTLRGHTDAVQSVAFAADGQVLASASHDKTVKLWDARTGQELRTLRGHKGAVASVAFTADGQVLASRSEDNTVKLWDARTGQQLRTLHNRTGLFTSLALAADGQVLASASTDRTVTLWDARTGQELRTLRGHTGLVACVAFAADGQVLVSASYDQTIRLWDVQTGQELRTLRGHTDMVWSVAFAADGQLLASASYDQTIKLWDARIGQELRTLRGHSDRVWSLAFAADGQRLASASCDKTVKLWDARTGQELRTLRGHTDYVTSVAFAMDSQVLASASHDHTVKLWDARSGEELRTLRGHTHLVKCVAFAADGQVLASASWDNTVKLWDARSGEELRTLRGHTDYVTSVAFAMDGQVLASASHDQTVKLWDVRTGHELRTLRGHTDWVTSAAFAADGRVLASASDDKTVKLWDARTGQERRTLRGHTHHVLTVAFAAEGPVLASASYDKTVKLWDARTGQELRTLRGHADAVRGVAFAANGQVLASASGDKTVNLWDVRTGQELRTLLRGHTAPITIVAFAADSQVLASASHDKTVKLWNTRTGQELYTLRGHTNLVTSVAFAADGKTLWSRDQFGKILAWDATTGKQLPNAPPKGLAPASRVAWSPDGDLLAVGQENGLVLLVPRAIAEKERRFRLWVTAPDLHLHRELAEQADKDKQPFALAFRLGRYLAGKNHYAAEPKQAAMLAGWLGTAAQAPDLLAGLPVAVKTPLHGPTFPDGIACAGVLYKNSGIAPARLLIGTSRALEGDPSSWLNHAFHGGALFRSGEHAKALAALNEAIRLHGKPHPLTHNLLALTHLQMGEPAKAKAALALAAPTGANLNFPVEMGSPVRSPTEWDDTLVHRVFQPEIEAALAKTAGTSK